MNENTSDAVLLHRVGAITQLTLNRPASLNAIDAEMAMALLAALERVASDPSCRCLTITGEGRGFCSGQALPGSGSAETLPADIAGVVRTRYVPIITLIRSLPLPVIAEVNGVAAGAGFALALAADLRVAAETAWFSCAFSSIGLLPDSGASFFLSRYLGLPRAFDLASTGRRLSAQEALGIGLVSHVFATDHFTDECRAFATRLAAGPTRALALTKRALDLAVSHSLAEQLEVEAELQQEASETDDFREGIRAFHERREPRFQGE